ncbi:septum formation initiator family protein [Mycobacterium sp. NPDC050551]|uniref:FtsB family cell division protein n=1 Tax=Mycobacterium sp. NPDC050551 TaxID=3155407 RepID=UPI00342D9D28
MPEAKRPDPKRRSPASRPGKPAKPGESKRDRPRGASPVRREPRAIEAKPSVPETTPEVADAIRESIAASAEQQSEQRFGSAARRAAILAAVVCVLTLTIAGPVRTYFGQRTEMQQLRASEAVLREQIAELEQQKVKLADPVFVAAQARERLGFVMPGDIPYQVQLPPSAVVPEAPDARVDTVPPGTPWYSALWGTIADAPHGLPPSATPLPPPPPGPPAPPPGG